MNRILASLTLAVALATPACGGDTGATPVADRETNTTDTAPAATPSSTTAPTPTTTIVDDPAPTPTDDDPTAPAVADSPDPVGEGAVTEADLARFVAAAEAALAGTSGSGLVVADPGTYVVLGQVACARFSDGETFADVAADLTADPTTAGATIGAAVETICPEHATVV